MSVGTYRVKAYFEYELDADNEKDAIKRLGECIYYDLSDGTVVTEIAEVAAEKISDSPLES